ncbi:cytochrome C peroxidase [Candidatus Tenderia electrophaga]|uniref:Cytochrome C peroxidase n=1 Tax=Candidatus Tenderia electrophaga TaxID=1748243 RepID=A0A0S2THC8_9GAMM|nr:cytochrome C peroxidase [Candidatus Tenderia electrophaga]
MISKIRLNVSTRVKALFIGGIGLVAAAAAGVYFLQSPPEPTPVADFSAPFVFGKFSIPKDNPLTEEGFELGRRLFYDPRLSGPNTTSCASCHLQKLAFTDGLANSVGVHGGQTAFSSMSLVNLLWGPQQFFWNGRAQSLEDQVLRPIQDPIEMDQDLERLVEELREDEVYQQLFRVAYGGVSADAIAKALSTFMRMLISSNSKYDQFLRGELRLSEQEELGRKLFVAHPDVSASLRGGNCVDCHAQFHTAGFSDGLDGFSNNGLDVDEDLRPGLMTVTGNSSDRGKFKVPSLRNIAVTAPYMHDGRFATLEEVMEHYNRRIQHSETVSPLILQADNQKIDPDAAQGLNLGPDEVEAIIAFLHTLTDEHFLSDSRFSDPFAGERE